MHIFIQDKLENRVEQKNNNNLHTITPLENTDASSLGYIIHIYILIRPFHMKIYTNTHKKNALLILFLLNML